MPAPPKKKPRTKESTQKKMSHPEAEARKAIGRILLGDGFLRLQPQWKQLGQVEDISLPHSGHLMRAMGDLLLSDAPL